MATTSRHYWDAGCFIAIFKKEVGRYENCLRLFQDAQRGKFQIVTSVMSVAECSGGGALDQQTDLAIRAFFEQPAIRLYAIDLVIAEESRHLQRWCRSHLNHKLNVRDAIHAATALRSNADQLATFDDGLLWFDEKLTCSNGTILQIRHPVWEGNLELPIQ